MNIEHRPGGGRSAANGRGRGRIVSPSILKSTGFLLDIGKVRKPSHVLLHAYC